MPGDIDVVAKSQGLEPFVCSRIDAFLAEKRPPTPCLVIDLATVQDKYRALAAMFPAASIYYAVKANPNPAVIAALAPLGANFDLASDGEIARCGSLGIPASRFSFGNTIKREAEIADAHAAGIGLFAFDCEAELEKLARAAPRSQVFCRLLVGGKGSEWPLSRKFGCAADIAAGLLVRARALGLHPAGLSFHVGSQQTDPNQWQAPIAEAATIFHACATAGIELAFLNLGGGLPAQYRKPIPELSAYAEAIDEALRRHFGGARPRILIEPGRYLVGDAGLLRSTVLLDAHKSLHGRRWIYLDAGRYNGLTETLGERIQYRIRTPRDGRPAGRVVLAGPTCDSTDILYSHTEYDLPLDLAIGDPVDFLSAGAYTASYASVEFNGFPPIRSYCC